MTCLQHIHKDLKSQFQQAEEATSIMWANSTLKPPVFKVRDKVWLSTQHLKINYFSTKLDDYPRPYLNTAIISPVAFCLQLPDTMWVHLVFYVSLLKLHTENPFPGCSTPPPPPLLAQGHEEP